MIKNIMYSVLAFLVVFVSIFIPFINVEGSSYNGEKYNFNEFPKEIDLNKYQDLLDELGLDEDIPFEEEIPEVVLKKLETSQVIQDLHPNSNNNNEIIQDGMNPSSIKVIYLGYYIKDQGYMGNHDLRNYVSYVDTYSHNMGWIALISGAISYYGLGIAPAILAQFASGNNAFEIVKSHAYAGNGMGWVHMYADGPNTLSVIPRRDFSSQFILYRR